MRQYKSFFGLFSDRDPLPFLSYNEMYHFPFTFVGGARRFSETLN